MPDVELIDIDGHLAAEEQLNKANFAYYLLYKLERIGWNFD